ncbi:MAG: serine hydrolase [Cyanobacteriota bacterium]|nr:serine hydrolase [Cyanobacteriota bacterium]
MQQLKRFWWRRKKASRRRASQQMRRSPKMQPTNARTTKLRPQGKSPAAQNRRPLSPTLARLQDRRALRSRPQSTERSTVPKGALPKTRKMPDRQGHFGRDRPAPSHFAEVKKVKKATPLSRRSPSKLFSPTSKRFLVYALRFSIIGLGLGAISGTLLSALDKTAIPLSAEANSSNQRNGTEAIAAPQQPPALPLKQESAELKTRIGQLIARSPQLRAGVLLVDLDTGTYVNIEGETSFAAASTIKLPLLVAFFQEVDAGNITLEEMLTMEEELIAAEAGIMQYKQPGTQFSALETVTQMITISDNTATNMILKRLGGQEILNQRFQQWNLSATAIHNPLPDLEGTNITSPMDLARLMAKVNRGDLISMRSRDRVLEILRNIVTNDLLPRGLDKDARIAHKTGNIGSLIADAGLVDTPTGKRYIAVIMVQRPHNDPQAKELIRDISREAYQYFNRPLPASQSSPAQPVISKQ